METKEIKKVTENDAKALTEGVEMAFDVIEELAETKDWVLKGKINLDLEYIGFKLGAETLNQRKKLKRRINALITKKTMRAANHFLREIRKYMSSTSSALKFEYSEKEKKIKAARKEYVKARDLAMKLYEEYKEEKGDYYKRK